MVRSPTVIWLRSRRGLIALVSVVLVGLLGMHGLSDHGTAGGHMNSDAVMVAGGQEAQPLSALVEDPVGGSHASVDHGSVSAPDMSAMSDEMASMCVALLLGLALLGLYVGAARRRWLFQSRSGVRYRSPSRVAAPDPPSLIWLSIHRC